MTILYFDCFSGASGDMILGALIDAGASLDAIRETVARLPIENVRIDRNDVTRGGIREAAIAIEIPDEATHRNYRDVERIIRASDIADAVKARALATFEVLAQAEGRIHGIDPGEVHFHEVGALDAVADVVGAAVALEHFAPRKIAASSIPLGSGTATSAHGTIPVPAPAVTEVLHGVPVRAGGEGEVITPTGAAILKAACDTFGEPPPMTLRATGYGAGARDVVVGTPNVLRVLVGDAIEAAPGTNLVLETNIDDMSPELIPYVIDGLIRAGAQDAWVTPILMKKGRHAFTLSALVDAGARERVMEVLYRETTTLGLRWRFVEKDELLREWVEIDVEGQPVRVKVGRRGPDVVTISPEYEDCAKAARATGMPLKDVYERADRAVRQALKL
ncbi:MAG: nickel pincer cofactor biosynthesis protein LarC [Actinomycetota bacterium]|nr:nickel pincer cofactor biosynthesis protein LarC [Actinomycetota bacterium]